MTKPLMCATSVVVALGVLSCDSPPVLHTVRTPGVERIPLGIVIHPLFSTELLKADASILGRGGASESFDRGHMYINPPAETTLKVTGPSQRLTGLLSMELVARGFKLRDLPVEATAGEGDDRNAFAVSLALLDELRERNNVRAILIGNAFFTGSSSYSDDARVTDLYVKMVDVETLDVICQISLAHDWRGRYMEDIARNAAEQLAREAGLPPAAK